MTAAESEGLQPAMVNGENGDEHPEAEGINTSIVAGVKDPKKEKEEKKRLEKERKEKEKQEKEEAKRLKKEEEKQKKQEQKEQKQEGKEQKEGKKSTAPSRRTEREEKKKFAIPNIFALKREGVRPKRGAACRVLLLDGSEMEVTLDVRTDFVYLE